MSTMIGGSGARVQMMQQQASASSVIALTSGTWVTVLDTTKNVRCQDIVLWQDTANEDLEVRITDDVGAEVVAFTATHSTLYYIRRAPSVAGTRYSYDTTFFTQYAAFMIESRTFKVELRKTSAAGANPTRINVKYAKIP